MRDYKLSRTDLRMPGVLAEVCLQAEPSAKTPGILTSVFDSL